MQIWTSIKTSIRDEATQKKINYYFCVLFFLFTSLNLIYKGFQTLPDHWLFFLTCDAFELFFMGLGSYLIYYKILPSYSLAFKVWSIILFLIALLALAYLKYYRRGILFAEVGFSEFSSYVGLSFMLLSLFYFFDNLNLFLNNAHVKTQEALKLAQQQLLKQQFNPHFLFNAFNSLYSLSLSKHPKTSESILRLSGMMRYMTDNTDRAITPLKHEFKFIQDYLAIERMRFGEQANIRFEQQGEVEGKMIAPLLLVTLVENAFKHGFYTNNPQAFVQIDATIEAKKLIFLVKNSIFQKQHFQASTRQGKGLDNLNKRLALSYPQDAQLEVQKTQKEFIATLRISLA